MLAKIAVFAGTDCQSYKLCKMLQSWGHFAYICYDIDDALRRLTSGEIDALVTDCQEMGRWKRWRFLGFIADMVSQRNTRTPP